MSNMPSNASSSGRLKDDLARLVHQIHKTSTIHKITSDSGVPSQARALPRPQPAQSQVQLVKLPEAQ